MLYSLLKLLKSVTTRFKLAVNTTDVLEGLLLLANNSNTSAEVLEKLSQHDEYVVRLMVARNTNTPVNILVDLAYDRCAGVRVYVASNNNTPPQTLVVLSGDGNYFVLYNVLVNNNTPNHIKQYIQYQIYLNLLW